MKSRVVAIGAALLALGGAVLLPLPARSSAPATPPPVSFAGDMVIPPPGSPMTRMPPLIQARGKLSYAPGTYDVHILAVTTWDGPAPWDEDEARSQVEALDAWYAAETEGRFRFRLAGVQVLPDYPGSLCGLDPALAHAKSAIAGLRRSPGATDVMPVVLAARSPACDAAGMAWLGRPGAWISVDPEYPQTAIKTFIHEIGHNIGLVHSAALPDADPSLPWPDGARPRVSEYGDSSDVMGIGGQWNCTAEECRFNLNGLHGHNRHLLRAVAPDQIDYVQMPSRPSESRVVELVSEEANVSGTQLVYLPWRNRSTFMLEYRPALGTDFRIGDQYGPGAGVYLRVIGASPAHTIARYPTQNRADWSSIALPVGPAADEYSAIPLGHREGASVTLTDGSVVEVLSTLEDRASVRITRPADTQPPTLTTPQIFYGNGTCSRYPCTAKSSAMVNGRYNLVVPFGEYTDNQWVSYAKVTVNGTLLEEFSRPEPDGLEEVSLLSPDFRRPMLRKSWPPGTYTFAYSYRDLAGNEGTNTYRVTLPKAGR